MSFIHLESLSSGIAAIGDSIHRLATSEGGFKALDQVTSKVVGKIADRLSISTSSAKGVAAGALVAGLGAIIVLKRGIDGNQSDEPHDGFQVFEAVMFFSITGPLREIPVANLMSVLQARSRGVKIGSRSILPYNSALPLQILMGSHSSIFAAYGKLSGMDVESASNWIVDAVGQCSCGSIHYEVSSLPLVSQAFMSYKINSCRPLLSVKKRDFNLKVNSGTNQTSDLHLGASVIEIQNISYSSSVSTAIRSSPQYAKVSAALSKSGVISLRPLYCSTCNDLLAYLTEIGSSSNSSGSSTPAIVTNYVVDVTKLNFTLRVPNNVDMPISPPSCMGLTTVGSFNSSAPLGSSMSIVPPSTSVYVALHAWNGSEFASTVLDETVASQLTHNLNPLSAGDLSVPAGESSDLALVLLPRDAATLLCENSALSSKVEVKNPAAADQEEDLESGISEVGGRDESKETAPSFHTSSQMPTQHSDSHQSEIVTNLNTRFSDARTDASPPTSVDNSAQKGEQKALQPLVHVSRLSPHSQAVVLNALRPSLSGAGSEAARRLQSPKIAATTVTVLSSPASVHSVASRSSGSPFSSFSPFATSSQSVSVPNNPAQTQSLGTEDPKGSNNGLRTLPQIRGRQSFARSTSPTAKVVLGRTARDPAVIFSTFAADPSLGISSNPMSSGPTTDATDSPASTNSMHDNIAANVKSNSSSTAPVNGTLSVQSNFLSSPGNGYAAWGMQRDPPAAVAPKEGRIDHTGDVRPGGRGIVSLTASSTATPSTPLDAANRGAARSTALAWTVNRLGGDWRWNAFGPFNPLAGSNSPSVLGMKMKGSPASGASPRFEEPAASAEASNEALRHAQHTARSLEYSLRLSNFDGSPNDIFSASGGSMLSTASSGQSPASVGSNGFSRSPDLHNIQGNRRGRKSAPTEGIASAALPAISSLGASPTSASGPSTSPITVQREDVRPLVIDQPQNFGAVRRDYDPIKVSSISATDTPVIPTVPAASIIPKDILAPPKQEKINKLSPRSVPSDSPHAIVTKTAQALSSPEKMRSSPSRAAITSRGSSANINSTTNNSNSTSSNRMNVGQAFSRLSNTPLPKKGVPVHHPVHASAPSVAGSSPDSLMKKDQLRVSSQLALPASSSLTNESDTIPSHTPVPGIEAPETPTNNSKETDKDLDGSESVGYSPRSVISIRSSATGFTSTSRSVGVGPSSLLVARSKKSPVAAKADDKSSSMVKSVSVTDSAFKEEPLSSTVPDAFLSVSSVSAEPLELQPAHDPILTPSNDHLVAVALSPSLSVPSRQEHFKPTRTVPYTPGISLKYPRSLQPPSDGIGAVSVIENILEEDISKVKNFPSLDDALESVTPSARSASTSTDAVINPSSPLVEKELKTVTEHEVLPSISKLSIPSVSSESSTALDESSSSLPLLFPPTSLPAVSGTLAVEAKIPDSQDSSISQSGKAVDLLPQLPSVLAVGPLEETLADSKSITFEDADYEVLSETPGPFAQSTRLDGDEILENRSVDSSMNSVPPSEGGLAVHLLPRSGSMNSLESVLTGSVGELFRNSPAPSIEDDYRMGGSETTESLAVSPILRPSTPLIAPVAESIDNTTGNISRIPPAAARGVGASPIRRANQRPVSRASPAGGTPVRSPKLTTSHKSLRESGSIPSISNPNFGSLNSSFVSLPQLGRSEPNSLNSSFQSDSSRYSTLPPTRNKDKDRRSKAEEPVHVSALLDHAARTSVESAPGTPPLTPSRPRITGYAQVTPTRRLTPKPLSANSTPRRNEHISGSASVGTITPSRLGGMSSAGSATGTAAGNSSNGSVVGSQRIVGDNFSTLHASPARFPGSFGPSQAMSNEAALNSSFSSSN